MHVLLSEEELLLSASIYEQAVNLGAKSVQELEKYSDDRLWSSLAASDVLGLGLPETYGGFGVLTDASIVAMALGRALAPVPYLGCADSSDGNCLRCRVPVLVSLKRSYRGGAESRSVSIQ